MARGKFSHGSICMALAAAVALALIGWGGAAHAACTSCTFFGTGAGSGSNGTFESGFGIDALGGGSDAGTANNAFGDNALKSNTSGSKNTAVGLNALGLNTTGSDNAVVGNASLASNTSGGDNTAAGVDALTDNTTGSDNTATGDSALAANVTGNANTAMGVSALSSSTGDDNIAVGYKAGVGITTGSDNIALGTDAGFDLTTGSNNIDIGNEGVAAESNTIRVGTQGTQTKTFIAGIFGSAVASGAKFVQIDGTGHLGTTSTSPWSTGGVPSSARFKRDIRPMGDASAGVMKLRPVSFRYKADPKAELRYGLIAEEVERVYPELVTLGDDGKVEGVRYDLLSPLLLDEIQKQAKENIELRHKVDNLEERMNALEREVRATRPEHLASAVR